MWQKDRKQQASKKGEDKMDASRILTKVLVTDDDRVQRLVLRKTLEAEGYEVHEAVNGAKALKILSDHPDIRILLTDIVMPEMDGYDLIRSVRNNALRYMYIIVLTAKDDKASLVQALSLGADDFLTKPVFPDELKLRIRGGARLLKLEGHEELIFSMVQLSEFRSSETGYHLERVRAYSKLLAHHLRKHHPELKLTRGVADEIAKVSPLHDIGKVAIPDYILHKLDKLTSEEWVIMKTHSDIGGKMLRNIYEKTGHSYLWIAYEIAMYHHEKWDGTGYPEGLTGENIPISARIIALADAYDALTTKRCYKNAFSHETAKSIIIEGKGHHFDPMIADAFLALEEAFSEVRNEFADTF
jgi:putative two-component system response regulator